MASLGGEQQISSNNQAAEPVQRSDSREGSIERKVAKDRDEKLKLARERQNEERQRKIEELRAQAEAAQRYREQKEEERRRRIDEIRSRDSEKRHQVEERKRAIMEAEKERREYILRKNQERESRLETKKRDRNSYGFAFGSSTPRLLEPDFGLVSPSTFWGHRRSTSISNVAGASLSRRSSERELADSGSKKRATSASGTDRHDGSRSGNVTPGGSMNASRPGSAMSTSTTMSTSGLVARRSAPAMRKPRPASIAGTGVSLEELNKHKREHKPPVKNSTPPTSTSAQNTPKRTSNMMSTSLIVTSSSARLSSAEKKTPAKREPVTPKAPTPKPLSKTSSSDRLNRASSSSNNNNSSKEKPKDNLPSSMIKSAIVAASTTLSSVASNSSNNNSIVTAPVDKEKRIENAASTAAVSVPTQSKDEKNALNAVKTEEVLEPITVNPTAGEQLPKPDISVDEKSSAVAADDEKVDQGNEKNGAEKESAPVVVAVVAAPTPAPQAHVKPAQNGGGKENSEVRELTPPASEGNDLMTASMIAKSKITTEGEAKAALAERRRLARVEAERQAELERQRVEAERLAEIKRQEEEAERQRQFEEESTRLAELQRKGEEERLRQAIEEAKQREEEERLKREDEERQRVEREEAEKKAKEEAEKQRIEVAERLKREEKEREERRKRVEAIMSRTRKAGGGGGSASGTPNSTPSKENNESSTQSSTPNDAEQPQQQQNAVTTISSENSSTSGSSATTTATTPTPIPAETTTTANVAAVIEPQNTQAMYEQSVIDKETALINSFSNMIIDENAKNLQQLPQQLPQQQIVEVTNGKLLNVDFVNTDALLQNSTSNSSTTTTTVANGNGHLENINNKNDINILQDDVVPATNQLIDFSIESQDINNAVNYNNNNSLLTTTTNTLVTADSHENKDISLL